MLSHDVEFYAIDDGVIVDRSGMCRTSTKCLKVGLSRSGEILVCDRRERQQLNLVDLDHDRTAPVGAADLDLRPRPEPIGDSDGSVRYSIAKVRTELHAAIVAGHRRCAGDM